MNADNRRYLIDVFEKRKQRSKECGLNYVMVSHEAVDAIVGILVDDLRNEDGTEWYITHEFDDNEEAMRPLGRVVVCKRCGYLENRAVPHYCPECGAKTKDVIPKEYDPAKVIRCRDCWKQDTDECPYQTNRACYDDDCCEEGERYAEKRAHD